MNAIPLKSSVLQNMTKQIQFRTCLNMFTYFGNLTIFAICFATNFMVLMNVKSKHSYLLQASASGDTCSLISKLKTQNRETQYVNDMVDLGQ